MSDWWPTCDAGVAHDTAIQMWPMDTGDFRWDYPIQPSRYFDYDRQRFMNPKPVLKEDGLVTGLLASELKAALGGAYRDYVEKSRRRARCKRGRPPSLRFKSRAGTMVIGVGVEGLGEGVAIVGMGVKEALTYEVEVEADGYLAVWKEHHVHRWGQYKSGREEQALTWEPGKIKVAKMVADADLGVLTGEGVFKPVSALEVGDMVQVQVGTDDWLKYRPLHRTFPLRKTDTDWDKVWPEVFEWGQKDASDTWLAAGYGYAKGTVEMAFARSCGVSVYRTKSITQSLPVTRVACQGIERVYGLNVTPNWMVQRSVNPMGYSAGGFIVRSATLSDQLGDF